MTAVYRNADGVDGLPRRNKEKIILKNNKIKHNTIPELVFFFVFAPWCLVWDSNKCLNSKTNKQTNLWSRITHLESIQKLPVEVNDVGGACIAFFTRITLTEKKNTRGQTHKSQKLNKTKMTHSIIIRFNSLEYIDTIGPCSPASPLSPCRIHRHITFRKDSQTLAFSKF